MYSVDLKNNYSLAVFMDDGNRLIGPHEIFPGWGTHRLNIRGMGDLAFFDLGDYKIARFTNKDIPWTLYTWGGLIRYRGQEAYFRYEGNGVVNVELDRWGGVKLNFPQGGMMVRLEDLVVV
ncbi:hypothetical protein [Methylomagnum ishizawai]|uniref:hypothetical protein n=1 Tax=Methylomagnum ishizawai TaxID=1760988 RepID=UPI001C33642B|nr:hypothetical protein [Methylomagnum ishizawai]BBL76741.1 hypothetical protein MishRS11D_38390 [Methylomagnum ishizawai]